MKEFYIIFVAMLIIFCASRALKLFRKSESREEAYAEKKYLEYLKKRQNNGDVLEQEKKFFSEDSFTLCSSVFDEDYFKKKGCLYENRLEIPQIFKLVQFKHNPEYNDARISQKFALCPYVYYPHPLKKGTTGDGGVVLVSPAGKYKTRDKFDFFVFEKSDSTDKYTERVQIKKRLKRRKSIEFPIFILNY